MNFSRAENFGRKWAAPGAVLVGILAGCSNMGPAPSSTTVTATFAGLPAGSPGDGHYELWISFAQPRAEGAALRHSAAASAGKFRIDASGRAVDLAGRPVTLEVSPADPNAQVDGDGNIVWPLAADAFVTVEAEGDDDDDPNLPGIAGGPFVNGVSRMSTSYADAINLDLTGAAGSFLLATPTTSATDDETQGIWFVEPGGLAASLNLPVISASRLWTYEAWYRDLAGERLVSLGGFRDPSGTDFDGAGPSPGPGDPYEFPGSDFPFGMTGEDLSQGTIFLTLEPPFDADGGAPFFLRVLEATVNGAAAGTPVTMARSTASPPGGTVEIPFSP